MEKIKVAILKNETEYAHSYWVLACQKYPRIVDFQVIDFFASNWLEYILNAKFDIYLTIPPAHSSLFKNLYDERIWLLDSITDTLIFPSPLEIYLYENKRFFYSWLSVNNINHPKTQIFYFKNEAIEFITNSKYPIVAKSNIGASGSGVHIFDNKASALNYVNRAFSRKGAPKRWGPNLSKGNIMKRVLHYFSKPEDIKPLLAKYKKVKNDLQIGFVLFQQHIQHDFEWRVVVIGESYFVYYFTLKKRDVFAFVMVMYMCTLFFVIPAKGGGFNLVAIVTIMLYLLNNNRLPGEVPMKNRTLMVLIFLWALSSVLGWFTNYTGTFNDLLFSIASFGGVLLLIIVSSRLVITQQRISVFLKINFFILLYTLIITIFNYVGIKFPFNTPFMPEGGAEFIGAYARYNPGLIGIPPISGQFNAIMVGLFAAFLFLDRSGIFMSRKYLMIAVLTSLLIVFSTVVRSAFYLSIFGIVVVLLLQHRIVNLRFTSGLYQVMLVILLGVGTMFFVERLNLGYVFERIDQIEAKQESAGGLSMTTIMDGTFINRDAAFYEAMSKFESKDHWFFGYGWGISQNNRNAFYTDTNVKRGSAHSQIFAVLFLFGWIGFFAFFLMHFIVIFNAFTLSGNKQIGIANRIFAVFSLIMVSILLLDGIKADNISIASYFGATMILMGLAYANYNTSIQQRILNNPT